MLPLLLLKSVLFLMLQLDVNQGLAQSCLQSAAGGPIPFDNLDPSLPNGSQVIVTSYQFQCCGNIREWQTAVRRDGSYTLHFQVWRPSPTVESDGCYSLVGENRFISTMLDDDILVTVTPQPTNIISVQPGDVLGYYSVNTRRDRGIALDDDLRSETVWYHTSTDPQIPVVGEACPLPVGAGPGRTLRSSTSKGPVLSASLVISNCTSQTYLVTTHTVLPTLPSHVSASDIPPLTPSASDILPSLPLLASDVSSLPLSASDVSPLPLSASNVPSLPLSASDVPRLPTNYLNTPPPVTTPANAIGVSVKEKGLIAGVCVSAVLVVTLGILAAAIAIYRKKAEGKGKRTPSESDSSHSSRNMINAITSLDQHHEMTPPPHQQIPLSHFHQQNEEELTQNVAYISTPGIAAEANVCYSSTAPANQDDFYESI